MKNKTVGVGVIERNHDRSETSAHSSIEERKRERTRSSLDFETLPMKIAHSRMHYKNHLVSVLEKAFPHDVQSQYVDEYFPFAEGGPLYVDLPRHEYNVNLCRKKAHVMRDNKLRYVYLEKGATLETAILMLEGKLK